VKGSLQQVTTSNVRPRAKSTIAVWCNGTSGLRWRAIASNYSSRSSPCPAQSSPYPSLQEALYPSRRHKVTKNVNTLEGLPQRAGAGTDG